MHVCHTKCALVHEDLPVMKCEVIWWRSAESVKWCGEEALIRIYKSCEELNLHTLQTICATYILLSVQETGLWPLADIFLNSFTNSNDSFTARRDKTSQITASRVNIDNAVGPLSRPQHVLVLSVSHDSSKTMYWTRKPKVLQLQ